MEHICPVMQLREAEKLAPLFKFSLANSVLTHETIEHREGIFLLGVFFVYIYSDVHFISKRPLSKVE